jgi:hypothetical protein
MFATHLIRREEGTKGGMKGGVKKRGREGKEAGLACLPS